MPIFEYVAKGMDGKHVKERMEAPDRNSVMNSLRSRNLYPESIGLVNTKGEISLSTKISMKDLAIFCRQFSVLLISGISVLKSLEICLRQTEGKKMKQVLDTVLENVQKGQSLSEAFSKHKAIPNLMVSMIQAGEASGTLDNIMNKLSEYYDKEYKQNRKIKSALTYPVIVFVFAIVVVTCLVIFVLPTFVEMIQSSSNAKLPLPTKIVMGISSFIGHYGILVLIAIILIIIAFNYYKTTEGGRYKIDKLKLGIPVLGSINTRIASARFAKTFGVLMGSGVSVLESIAICSKIVGNAVVERVLNSAEEELRKGVTLGIILDRKRIFPPMLTQMIKIGEESGTLDYVLNQTSEFYDSEVEAATSQLITLIEPVIIIFLAVMVGFIIISMILPIMEMYNTVQ